MPKLKTLIFHPALAPYRVDLFNELACHLDLKVLFFRENLVSQQFDQDYLRSLLKCEYEYLCSGIDIFGKQMRWGIGRAISQFNPDVLVCHEYGPTSLLAAARKKFASDCKWALMVWTADNVHTYEEAGLFRRLARKVVLGITDGMVVYTEATKSRYVSYGIPTEGIGVCPNIQKEGRFRNLLRDAQPIAGEYLRGKNLVGKRVVLFVGRLALVKGLDRLIRAFEKTGRAFTDAVLVIVGDGPERRSLLELAARAGLDDRVQFVGRFEGRELAAWYLVGQIFVLPSHFEPFGAVVNEALLAGMPVLCSSAAGAADIIREGRNGSVFDPYDVPGMAERMADMLASVPPLQDGTIALRENLMPISFQDGVFDFVRAVEYAAQRDGTHDSTS